VPAYRGVSKGETVGLIAIRALPGPPRLALHYDPNEVMKPVRTGYQGKGRARRLGRCESYRERKDRLAAQGRDLAAERRAERRRRTTQRALRVAS
jgi:hypothetical protein